MNERTREGFYTLWTIAILVCLIASVFLLVYVSIIDGGESADVPAPQADAVQPAEGADQVVQPAEGADQAAQPAEGTDQAVQPAEGADQAVQPAEGADQAVQPAEDLSAAASVPSSPVILQETPDAGDDYQNRLVFLGDSTTYGFRAYDILPKTQVWTPSSGTLSIFNWPLETIEYFAPDSPDTAQNLSLADTMSARKPEYLIITLGVNGVAVLNEQEFREDYLSLVQTLQAASPETKIICQSIYPVIDGKVVEGINNAVINAANGWILSIAEQTGTRYLNTHDALMDETGNMISSFDSGDGLHVTPDGYRAILQYVRTHSYQ